MSTKIPDKLQRPTNLPYCKEHGTWVVDGQCLYDTVWYMVDEERQVQDARYGDNMDNPVGFGPREKWLSGVSDLDATEIQQALRVDYEQETEGNGKLVSWAQLIREEVAEAFQEDDLLDARDELIQVAALAIKLAEALTAQLYVETE
mgnify:CR=1 FL=1